MEPKTFSAQEWVDMARLYVRDILTDEGIAIVEYQIDHDPGFRKLVILELAIHDNLKQQESKLMAESFKSKSERIRKEREQREAIEQAKKGVKISKKSARNILIAAAAVCIIAAIIFGVDSYNIRQEEIAKAKEREKQLMAITKQRLKDSLALAAKNPTSTSIGSTTQNIVNNSPGRSFSSGVATTNSGQSRDSVGSQQPVPVESRGVDQATYVATVNVPYQEGGSSFSGDQSNQSIAVVIYQIKTGNEKYTLEGKKLTVYLNQENLNRITSDETKGLIVRKAAETLLYIRKDGKEILELEDGQVFSIK